MPGARGPGEVLVRVSRAGTAAVPVLVGTGPVVGAADVDDMAAAVLRSAAEVPDVVLVDLRRVRRVDPVVRRLAELSRTLEVWPACEVLALVSPAALRRVSRDGFGPRMHISAVARALTLLDDAVDRPRASVRLEATMQAPAVARRFVAAVLQGWGRLDDLPAVALVLDELVTNVVVHAMTPVDVVVLALPGGLAVATSDRAPDGVHVLEPAADDERGRGLQLVGSLASAWGVLPRHGGGKTVWAVCGS